MASEPVAKLEVADPGECALRHLDAILALQPKADPTLFSDCTRCLARLRDRMIADHRTAVPTETARVRLTHVNAVISVVMAGHFPLGPVPWGELRKARTWLAEIVQAGG